MHWPALAPPLLPCCCQAARPLSGGPARVGTAAVGPPSQASAVGLCHAADGECGDALPARPPAARVCSFAPFPPAKLRKLVADVDEASELLQQGK